MRFRLSHETVYRYASPASESYGEFRIYPVATEYQSVNSCEIRLDPDVPVDTYTDYFGNRVGTFAVPSRHRQLRVKMDAEVVTRPPAEPGSAAEIAVGDAKRLNRDQRIDLYLYRLPTPSVPLNVLPEGLSRDLFRESTSLRRALLRVNEWIYSTFTYTSGATDVGTPIETVLQERKGVCQDFSHLMLSILRTRGLVARYVSGYIEPYDPTRTDPELIGAAASHAWVEAFLPNGRWWGLDPTNNQVVGERHVRVAVGRDYPDVAPLRGTYKGAVNQKLQVIVSMKREEVPGESP